MNGVGAHISPSQYLTPEAFESLVLDRSFMFWRFFWNVQLFCTSKFGDFRNNQAYYLKKFENRDIFQGWVGMISEKLKKFGVHRHIHENNTIWSYKGGGLILVLVNMSPPVQLGLKSQFSHGHFEWIVVILLKTKTSRWHDLRTWLLLWFVQNIKIYF